MWLNWGRNKVYCACFSAQNYFKLDQQSKQQALRAYSTALIYMLCPRGTQPEKSYSGLPKLTEPKIVLFAKGICVTGDSCGN